MHLWINHKPRKDGKKKCTIGFDNGKRYNKLFTPEQLKAFIEKNTNQKTGLPTIEITSI